MIPTFEKRWEPHRWGRIPEPVYFQVFAVFALASFVVFIPTIPFKIIFALAALGMTYTIIDTWIHFDDWYVRTVIEKGKKTKVLPTFAGKKNYHNEFTWRTYADEHALLHDDGTVSLAFIWDGVENRFASPNQLGDEHARRVAMLKQWPHDQGLCVEHHLLRAPDSALVDAYLAEGDAMYQESPMPPIIKDVRNQLADLYRPLGKSNRVMTVLSLAASQKKGIWSLISPDGFRQKKTAKQGSESLRALFAKLQSEYPGARLLTADEYRQCIERVYHPYNEPTNIDWRFHLAEQLVSEKPEVEDDCLRIGDVFYKVMLVQNYPSLSADWTFGLSDGDIDTHVSQILFPANDRKILDDNKKQTDHRAAMMSNKHNVDKSISSFSDSIKYRKYVAERGLPIVYNTYVVTMFGRNKEHLIRKAIQFKTNVNKDGGKVRDDLDVQHEMFKTRLPGMGYQSLFKRDDHADVIAAMMPFTTFPKGSDRPECLRICMNGQLVGLRPSDLKVPDTLVVGEKGGGKDNQFGLIIAETYKRIRYDIIELGNSYQGIIEAIGGHYCRAKEQAVNPFAPYNDYLNALSLEQKGTKNLVKLLLDSQTSILTPIFKGIQDTDDARYSNVEQVIMDQAVRWCYENPLKEAGAPTLALLENAFDKVVVENGREEEARDHLAETLHTFLKTEIGSTFSEQDQFVISPIANAIDFNGLKGDLMKYYLNFMCIRLAQSAMARGARSQIVLNEFRMLWEQAQAPVKLLTLTIDRMGRKDWVGLTRITQGAKEVQAADAEAINSIPNRVLLARGDQHEEIGEMLQIPSRMVARWKHFPNPDSKRKVDYREALVRERGEWYHLYLKFPQLVLDIMNTDGADKTIRDQAYRETKDPYKRIELLRELQADRDAETQQEQPRAMAGGLL